MDIKTLIAKPNSLGKNERLKSRKLIGQLFEEGKNISSFPVRMLYHLSLSSDKPSAVQAAFSTSSRNFKKAVDRNRIKRLLREAYRMQKHPLNAALAEKPNRMLSIFFIYTGKELPEYLLIKEKINIIIQSLIKKIAEQ